MTISVLLIAPASGLAEVYTEVQNIVNLAPRLAVWLVGRPCTGMAVLDAAVRKFDAIHVAGHGNEDGVALDDGLWPTSSLLQVVEMTSPRVLYLSTCKSMAIAKEVTELTTCDCIATLAEQNDKRAAELATAFWRTVATQVNHQITAYLRTARHDRNSTYVRSLMT